MISLDDDDIPNPFKVTDEEKARVARLWAIDRIYQKIYQKINPEPQGYHAHAKPRTRRWWQTEEMLTRKYVNECKQSKFCFSIGEIPLSRFQLWVPTSVHNYSESLNNATT